MEKALLSELLEGLTAFQSYLSKDLAKEKLSSYNQKNRHLFIQQLDGLIKKIQSVHPSVRPKVEAPIGSGSGDTIQKPPPIFKAPPPVPPPEEEGNDVYEIPEKSEPEPSGYTSFQPASQEDPQEEYLAMEAEERDDIQEETYEEPSQTVQEIEPDVYEDPQVPDKPISTFVTPPPNQQATMPHSTSQSGDSQASGYMDPVMLREEDEKRKSIVPVHLIDDWDEAYDSSNVNKKKEKVKVSNLKDVLVRSWLEKLGGRNRTSWQKRYCALSDPFMYFYEKESSGTYNNRVAIPGFVPNPSAELTKPKRNQFAFKLSSTLNGGSGKPKDYYFRAKSEQERDKWVEALRTVFERGRMAMERKKSQTLPASSRPSGAGMRLQAMGRSPSDGFQPEEYEALTAAVIEEEEDDDNNKDQEEYVDVTPANDGPNEQNSQEEYVEVQPGQLQDGDEPQEDYVEAEDIRQQMSPQQSSTSHLPPLPPPPTFNSTPTAPSITQQPLPVPRKQHRPDPVVDTKKVYIQDSHTGVVQYNSVYVLLWDFEGVDNDELRLSRGDLVLVPDPSKNQEWWYGELLSQDCSKKMGLSGLFPASYCTVAFEAA